MTATATFHFAAQASGLKYLIAPSASVTATGDSLTGIGSSAWEIVGTAGSVPADWVLSSAGLHSVVVTAPAGTNKAAILQRTVTSGRDTLVTTAKLYSGTELPCTNETFESDTSNGWGALVSAAVAAGTPYASTPAANTPAGSAGASANYARGDHAHPVQNPLIATGALTVGQTSQNSSLLGDTVTLNTSASGKVSICEAAAEHCYIEQSATTTRVWAISNTLDLYGGGAAQLRSGGVIGISAASWIILTGRLNDNNVATPAQFVANTNNFALTTAVGVYRMSTDASRDLTGIVAPAFVGDRIKIHNVGTQPLVLKHESASSTAANRFKFSGAADITLAADGCATLWYDGTTARWRCESHT